MSFVAPSVGFRHGPTSANGGAAIHALTSLTPAMLDAIQRVGEGAVTAREIRVEGIVLKLLAERGLLDADREGRPPIYRINDFGRQVVHILTTPPQIIENERPVERIQRIVAETFRIPVIEMVSERRARHIARPRQVAMYLARETTTMSLPAIGGRFGGRDHTTVMHACRRVEELIESDPEFYGKVSRLRELLGGTAPVRLGREMTDEERLADASRGSAMLLDAITAARRERLAA